MGKAADSESLREILQHREDVKREIDDVLARHAVAQERVAALSREHQQWSREAAELNRQYVSLAAARLAIEKRIAARSDGLQALMPGGHGTASADKHATMSAEITRTTGPHADGNGSPTAADVHAAVLRPYLPPHGRSGQRLKSSAMVRDVMAALAGEVSRAAFIDAFFARFPADLLRRYWDKPHTAVAVAFDRAVQRGVVAKIGADTYCYRGEPAGSTATEEGLAMTE